MEFLLAAIIVMSFMATFIVLYYILRVIMKKNQVVRIRLDTISKLSIKNTEGELNKPLFVRMIKPVFDNISSSVLKVTPTEIASSLEKMVVMAGNPYNLSFSDWINIQVFVVIGLPMITFAIGYYFGTDVRQLLFFAVIAIMAGFIVPYFLLSRKLSARRKEITNTLPNILDMLTVSVEAGLGFDSALAKVVDKMPGALAYEFSNYLQELKLGKQKKEALRDIVERTNVPDLNTFIGSIIQAEQLGVSISNVLRLQSEQMRQKRKQRAQEKAMKAPLKMLFPMVLFIFPTIFVVLLGPAGVRMMSVFMK